VTSIASAFRAYVDFWLRRSTVIILLCVAFAFFGIDTLFYYVKLAPDAQSAQTMMDLGTGVIEATSERRVREGRYTYFADPYNRTPSCREEPTIGHEALKVIRGVFEAPTTGGTLSVKEILDLEFAQWLIKHFINGEIGKQIDTDGAMTATCTDIRIVLPSGARLPGDALFRNLRVEMRETVPDPGLGSTVDFLQCPVSGFEDCQTGFARVTDASILLVGDECVLRVVIMNWMQKTISIGDTFHRDRWGKFEGDRVARETIDYLPPGSSSNAPASKIVCKDEIPR
jgi:hypothetical protein